MEESSLSPLLDLISEKALDRIRKENYLQTSLTVKDS